MTWLYPQFLWALFALLIPIAIHLFNFRRYKKIAFSRVSLLTEIRQQTKTGNKLKKLLILAARLLALTCLVLAFAQPVITRNKTINSGKRYISLLIDNSYSMNLNGEEGQLLEAAKNRARAIVNSADNGDQFNIVTSDMNAALMHFNNKQSTLENIDKIKIGSGSHPLNDLLEVQKRSLHEKTGRKMAYCISDFQAVNSKPANDFSDSGTENTWIRLKSSESSNISIDTCYLESPVIQAGQNISLVAQVSNYTGKNVEGLTLELQMDGKPKGIAVFNIPSYGSEKQKINFTLDKGGRHEGLLKLPGDNIPLDDELYFSLNINNNFQVLSISGSNDKYMPAIFADNPGFEFKAFESGSVNYNLFKTADLIVLQGVDNIQTGLVSELRKFVKNGGTLVAFPLANGTQQGGLGPLATEFGFGIEADAVSQTQKVSTIELNHPVFSHIFEKQPKKPELPLVQKYYNLSFSSGTDLFKLSNGRSFLHDLPSGKGRLIIGASALDKDWSNFQNHALFLPIMLKSAMLGSYKNDLYMICGETKSIFSGLPFETESGISLKSGNNTFVPEVINMDGEMFLNTNGEIESPGQYQLVRSGNPEPLAFLSFNLSRTESDTRTLDNETFEKLLRENNIENFTGSAEQLSAEFHKSEKGTGLWKWCISFALLFLLIEILLIRFFRNNAQLPA